MIYPHILLLYQWSDDTSNDIGYNILEQLLYVLYSLKVGDREVMYIRTNQIHPGKYEDIFKSIYIKYSERFANEYKDYNVPFTVNFDFGKCGDRYNKGILRESFYEHMVEITRNTPAFSITLTRAISMPDPVAGRMIYLIPDAGAIAALSELNSKLHIQKWRDYLYHENDFFAVVGGLSWVDKQEASDLIAYAINQTGFEISAQITQLSIWEVVDKDFIPTKIFNLKSG